MLKVILWLIADIFFIYCLIAFYSELGGYIILLLAIIAFFTWDLIRTIKHGLGK